MHTGVLRPWLFACLAFGSSPPAAARILGGAEDHCTLGDAEGNIDAFYPRGIKGWSEPASTVLACQFRSFNPTVDVCFCEHDEAFIGGDVYSAEIAEWGTVAAARAFLELLEVVDVMITPAGLSVERFETAIRGFAHGGGRLLQKHTGLLFRQLPAGNYLLLHSYQHPTEEVPQANYMSFRVLEHEVAHKHGRSWAFGSVRCPPETHCTDGVDNEGDGLVDCADAIDCRFDAACFPPRAVPGRVEAEDYRPDGNNYDDSDAGNNGGAYRHDDVDLWEFDGVYLAPWTALAEWTAYDIEVAASGPYTVTARYSCGGGCPGANLVSATVDGVEVATFAIHDTGDWIIFEDVLGLPGGTDDPEIWLDAGRHDLRLHFVDAAELSIDYLDFAAAP
jgi:hypothetical protein